MEHFFEESTEESRVKALIVANYFWAWARVIMPTAKKWSNRIAYIDLFSGPGRYADGTKSTPLLVLERAIDDANMRQMLVTIFNDVNGDHSQSLETAIKDLPGVDTLAYQPKVLNYEVGDQIVKSFEQMKLVPTLFFIDPWGYKGLSLRLINSVLKDWGCDCIFFFNYNRINMGLPNAVVDDHIDSLFGKHRADQLRSTLTGLSPDDRELRIVEELAQALKDMNGEYVLPFCFLNDAGSRTSHYLMFVSKHVRGYEIMKDVMAKQSSKADQGVPSFSYCLADRRYKLLFELTRPLDDLAEMLLDQFAGETLSMLQVFQRHHVGRPYVKKNYKDALQTLESEGKIAADPPASKRRANTFGNNVKVSFPPKTQTMALGRA